MTFSREMTTLGFALLLALSVMGGCGTTKFSDTSRTATEQLLISAAMEDAVDAFNFYPLSGRKIFIKSEGVSATDKEYLLSILRQQLAANGVLIQETKDTADYILEVATGAVGTDRSELIYGTKETSVPSILTMGTTASIPEIALVKRTDQKAKIKLTMWAYNRTTGAIVWQSGQKNKVASVRDRWILGMGPITKCSYNEKTQVGGDDVPFEIGLGEKVAKNEKPSVKTEATYRELDQEAIARLEKIRKEGYDAMIMDAAKEEEAKEGEVAESDKEGGEEKKEESAVEVAGGDPPKDKAEDGKPDPDSGKPDLASVPPAKLAEGPPVPKPAGSPPVPRLEFDDMELSLGTTVVPKPK